MEYRHQNLFGGVGEVVVQDLLPQGGPAPFRHVLLCRLSPLGRVGSHSQERDSELIVVLEGQGEAEINGARQPLRQGTVLGLALGSSLALHNTSAQQSLQYLIIKASPPSPMTSPGS